MRQKLITAGIVGVMFLMLLGVACICGDDSGNSKSNSRTQAADSKPKASPAATQATIPATGPIAQRTTKPSPSQPVKTVEPTDDNAESRTDDFRPVATPSREPIPTPKEKHPPYVKGERFGVDHLEYVIWSAAWTNQLTDNPYLDARPDAKFLLVELTVLNDDKKARSIPPFRLVDKDGNIYDTSDKAFYLEDCISILDTLNPGVSKQGYIVFDIPQDRTYLLLVSGGVLSDDYALVNMYSSANATAPKKPKKDMKYTVIKCEETPGEDKAIVDIRAIVSGDINEDRLRDLLKELYNKARVTIGFNKNGKPSHVCVYLFASREDAESTDEKWLAMLSKIGDDPTEIQVCAKYAKEPPDVRFGLSEAKRKGIFKALCTARDEAQKDADLIYPPLKPGDPDYSDEKAREQQRKNENTSHHRLKDAETKIAKEHGITVEPLAEIFAEGIEKKWSKE